MKMPLFRAFDPRERLHDAVHSLAGVQWQYMGIAFVMAVFLWYTVTVRDKVDSWVDVRVEFKGAPGSLIIRDGMVNKVAVRVRAAAGLTRSLNSRDISVTLDLSHIVKGTNVLQITPNMLPFPNAFEVMEITPQRIQIVADAIETRSLPLESTFDGTLPSDFFIKSLKLTPPSVSVRGPETLVSGLRVVRIPVPLGGVTQPGVSMLRLVVPMLENTTVDPAQVNAQLEVAVRTKPVRLSREVTVVLPEGGETRISPAKVTVSVELPESQTANTAVLARVIATVNVPRGAHSGTQKLPVEVLLPEYAVLKDVSPKEVSVTFHP